MAVADHGERRRYQLGCRCDQCRLAEAEYQKRNRQRRAAKALKAVPDQPESDNTAPEDAPVGVVDAVQREVDGLAGVDGKPGLVATAVAMAKILDNPVAIAQHPAAAARLMDLLADLHKGGKKERGKLAAARDMIG